MRGSASKLCPKHFLSQSVPMDLNQLWASGRVEKEDVAFFTISVDSKRLCVASVCAWYWPSMELTELK